MTIVTGYMENLGCKMPVPHRSPKDVTCDTLDVDKPVAHEVTMDPVPPGADLDGPLFAGCPVRKSTCL